MIDIITNNDLSKINNTATVVFSASWCESCHKLLSQLGPLSDAINTKVYNVDVDDNEELADRYQIKSLPCTILFRDGKEKARFENNTFLNEIVEAARVM